LTATEPLTYFIDTVRNNSIQINDMSLNLSSKVLSIDFTNTNTNTNNSGGSTNSNPSFLQVTIPKALLGSISEVTSENYNKTSNTADKVVERLKTKENRGVTNVGDSVVDIDLNGNVTTDKILIKGQTSSLVSQ
jgi:hypothetical protein